MEERTVNHRYGLRRLSPQELLERFEHYINGAIVIDPQNDNDMVIFIELLRMIEKLSEEQQIDLSEKTIKRLSAMKIGNISLTDVLVTHIRNQFNQYSTTKRFGVNTIWLCASILNFQNMHDSLKEEKTFLHRVFMSALPADVQAINKMADVLNCNNNSPIVRLVKLINNNSIKFDIGSNKRSILRDGRNNPDNVSLLLMCVEKTNTLITPVNFYFEFACFAGHETNIKLLLNDSRIDPAEYAGKLFDDLTNEDDTDFHLLLFTDGRILTTVNLVLTAFRKAINYPHLKLLTKCLEHPLFDKKFFSGKTFFNTYEFEDHKFCLMKQLDKTMSLRSYNRRPRVKIMARLFEHKEVVQLKTFKEWINWAETFGLRDELSPLILCACDKFNLLIQPNLSKLFFGEINISNPLDKELPKELKGEIISMFYRVSPQ